MTPHWTEEVADELTIVINLSREALQKTPVWHPARPQLEKLQNAARHAAATLSEARTRNYYRPGLNRRRPR